MPVIFGPAARAEMVAAHDWYEARSPGLGTRFMGEVDGVVGRIMSAPEQLPLVLQDVRRARCRHFPYTLFFGLVDDTAHVLAVFHSSRDPRHWQSRV